MTQMTASPVEAQYQAQSVLKSQPHARGPFRPQELVSLRARQARANFSITMRVLDACLLGVIAIWGLLKIHHGPLSGLKVFDLLPFLALSCVCFFTLKSLGLYNFSKSESWAQHGLRLILALSLGLMTALLLSLLTANPLNLISILLTMGLWGAGLFINLHLIYSQIIWNWRSRGLLTPNIVLVGASESARTLIAKALITKECHILGIFDDRMGRVPENLYGVPVLGTTKDMMDHKILPYVDQVIIAIDGAAKSRLKALIAKISTLPNWVSLLVGADDIGLDSTLNRISKMPLRQVSGQAKLSTSDYRSFFKRLQDIAIGTTALIIFAPIMLLVAVLIKLDSKGPVFFRQKRHGFNNEAIWVWKFRSMRTECADATASRQVRQNDERITRIGRFIRKTSLDELPQLFNVLKGEMSLVGPRPHAIGMKTGEQASAQMVSEYAWRHRLKPGMTGLAAIKGSRGALNSVDDVQKRVTWDVEYIERQSFWFDLYIMAMTIPCLLGDSETIR